MLAVLTARVAFVPPIVASPFAPHIRSALDVGHTARTIVSQLVLLGRLVGNTRAGAPLAGWYRTSGQPRRRWACSARTCRAIAGQPRQRDGPPVRSRRQESRPSVRGGPQGAAHPPIA